jgi:hypothetical protein
MPEFTYKDKFLAPLVTDDVESRAADDVAVLGSFPETWRERLTVLKSYLVACLDNGKAPGDIFATKYDLYRKEFASTLDRARIAAAQASTDPEAKKSGVLTFTIERA